MHVTDCGFVARGLRIRRRCLVHRTSAPGAHRLGSAATVASMPLLMMFAKNAT